MPPAPSWHARRAGSAGSTEGARAAPAPSQGGISLGVRLFGPPSLRGTRARSRRLGAPDQCDGSSNLPHSAALIQPIIEDLRRERSDQLRAASLSSTRTSSPCW